MELLWAIIGAALSLVFCIFFDFAKQLRTPAGLFQVWHSTWQPTAETGWYWVTEELEIKRSIRGILLKSKNNSKGFDWRGRAKLVDNTYLTGEWRSIKPGSNAEGVFALTFATDGNCLLGYFLSRDLDRGKISSSFVLGRTEEDMIEGRKKIESMRIKFPKE